MPELEQYPPDPDGTGETRAGGASGTRNMPNRRQAPPTPRGNRAVPPPPAQHPHYRQRPGEGYDPYAAPVQPAGRARPSGARARRDSGLYLPLWSIALTVIVVIAVAVGLVLMVLGLGGNTPEDAQPVVIVNSPMPTTVPGAFPASPATPTIPPEINPGVSGDPPQPQAFVLQGPTLEAIASSTPTLPPVGVGVVVVVRDVEPEQLNVRDEAGTRGTEVVFRVDEGTRFVILEGPQQADGLTWWRVQNTLNQTQVGWAASNYLEVATEQ